MTNPRDNSRHIKARTGSTIAAKHWTTEAAVRMLMNNLDAEVAEDPQSLVVERMPYSATFRCTGCLNR